MRSQSLRKFVAQTAKFGQEAYPIAPSKIYIPGNKLSDVSCVTAVDGCLTRA